MKKETETIIPPFNDVEFLNTWGEWILYRKERHLANYVPRGLKRTFAVLYKDSNGDAKTAIAMIERSMNKNWQGIFPLPNNENGQPKKFDTDKIKQAIIRTASDW